MNYVRVERKGDYKALKEITKRFISNSFNKKMQVTGRPRGVMRKFEMSRIAFREHAHKGQIPGVKNLVGN